MKKLLAVFLCAGSIMLAGCASESAVEGKVTKGGKAVENASVTFMTEDGNVVGTGSTDAQGVFKLTTSNGKNKVPAGKYKVVVSKTAAVSGAPTGTDPKDMVKAGEMMMKMSKMGGPKNELPEKYNSIKSTPLTAEVPSKGPIELKID